ncbi:MAG: acetate--CoA ligase family protein, partial [Paralcaligenes sp.]
GNPADITADIFNDISKFSGALDAVLSDRNIDQLAILLASLPGKLALETSNAIIAAYAKFAKPILIGWSARRERASEAYDALEAAGIPILTTPERLGRAAGVLSRYAEIRRRMPVNPALEANRIQAKRPGRHHTLNEIEGKRLLRDFGIPVTEDVVIQPGQELKRACASLSFPVVVKVISPDLPHKTESGGVQINIVDLPALQAASDEVLRAVRQAAPAAHIEGILVSEMITDGLETLVGIINDPTFGPTVAFGLGGIFTEVLRDVTYRVAPFDLAVAKEMIGELRGYPLFEGVRGKPALDVGALAQALVNVSHMAWDLRDRLYELDINPLFVRPLGRGVAAADCLAVLAQS